MASFVVSFDNQLQLSFPVIGAVLSEEFRSLCSWCTYTRALTFSAVDDVVKIFVTRPSYKSISGIDMLKEDGFEAWATGMKKVPLSVVHFASLDTG